MSITFWIIFFWTEQNVICSYHFYHAMICSIMKAQQIFLNGVLKAIFYFLFTQYPYWKWMILPPVNTSFTGKHVLSTILSISSTITLHKCPSHTCGVHPVCFTRMQYEDYYLHMPPTFPSFTPGWLVDCLSCICIANDEFLSRFVFLSRWVPFSRFLRSGKKEVHSPRIISSEAFCLPFHVHFWLLSTHQEKAICSNCNLYANMNLVIGSLESFCRNLWCCYGMN